MERKRTKPEVWNAFEERILEKRMNGSAKKCNKVPIDIMVKLMASTASGRLKHFAPFDTQDYVPFSEHTELSVASIKKAVLQNARIFLRHSCIQKGILLFEIRSNRDKEGVPY